MSLAAAKDRSVNNGQRHENIKRKTYMSPLLPVDITARKWQT